MYKYFDKNLNEITEEQAMDKYCFYAINPEKTGNASCCKVVNGRTMFQCVIVSDIYDQLQRAMDMQRITGINMSVIIEQYKELYYSEDNIKTILYAELQKMEEKTA